ncbi:MAG: GntR family transcriptional regulator [Variibacter sp.]
MAKVGGRNRRRMSTPPDDALQVLPSSTAVDPSSVGTPGRAERDLLDELRERIATHEIPPGAKLFEQELAREFSVSRARVREVFAALELRGLIRRVPNRGAIVNRLELTQVFEIYDVREALEGLCVRLATQNAPAETWDDLIELFGPSMEQKIEGGDFLAYERANAAMRQRFIQAAKNPVLAAMLDSIHEKTRVIMRRVLILPGRAEKAIREHRQVLLAMRRGNAQEAETLKRKNIRSAIDDLKRFQQYVL